MTNQQRTPDGVRCWLSQGAAEKAFITEKPGADFLLPVLLRWAI